MMASGFNVKSGPTGADQCKLQWKHLTDSYKQYVDNGGTKATGKSAMNKPTFYEEMSKLIGKSSFLLTTESFLIYLFVFRQPSKLQACVDC